MAKRLGKSSVNWAELAERVPAEQRNMFIAFKTRSDVYLRKVLANPPEPPKLDWAKYRKAVPVAGMVDIFEKQYSALKIDYPKDTLSSTVDAQWAEIKKSIDQFVQASNANISTFEKEIQHTQGLLPYELMTMEDYRDAFPTTAFDPINRPTFWPHTPDEQLDYVDPEQAAQVKDH